MRPWCACKIWYTMARPSPFRRQIGTETVQRGERHRGGRDQHRYRGWKTGLYRLPPQVRAIRRRLQAWPARRCYRDSRTPASWRRDPREPGAAGGKLADDLVFAAALLSRSISKSVSSTKLGCPRRELVGLFARVIEELGDDLIQALRFTADDLDELFVVVFEGARRASSFNAPVMAVRGWRISCAMAADKRPRAAMRSLVTTSRSSLFSAVRS